MRDRTLCALCALSAPRRMGAHLIGLRGECALCAPIGAQGAEAHTRTTGAGECARSQGAQAEQSPESSATVDSLAAFFD